MGTLPKAKPAAATSTATPPVYAHRQRTERSLATLLLADLSLSTDAYATSNARVIDVIREALYVLAQHYQARATLLRFWGSAPCADSMCASSTSRASMNLGATRYTPIGALKPGFYTRMGAAVRDATNGYRPALNASACCWY